MFFENIYIWFSLEVVMEKTYFITFEGIDGVGKDTQLYRLVEAVKEDDNHPFGDKYSNIWITREPTKITKSGREISKLIRERDVGGEEATKFYVEDRKEHTKIIKEVLRHSHVFCSRYDLSTLAYQMTQGMDFDYLYELHGFDRGECIVPDITLVFDVPVDVVMERMKGRNSVQECFEKEEFQRKLRDNLFFCVERLREKGRVIFVVDGNQSRDDVTKEMVGKIGEVLKVL